MDMESRAVPFVPLIVANVAPAVMELAGIAELTM